MREFWRRIHQNCKVFKNIGVTFTEDGSTAEEIKSKIVQGNKL